MDDRPAASYDPADFQLDHAEAVAAIIELRGYAVEPHRADPERGTPAFAHTIGLEDLCSHPELCVVGLDGELAGRLLGEFVDHLRGGGELPVDAPFVGMLGPELPAMVVEVDPSAHPLLFEGAFDHYGHRPFRVLQVLYPDAAGRLPLDDDVDPELRQAQWVLG